MTIDTPLATPLDQVRFLIGDTDESLMSDQTINALLTINNDNVNKTAIQCLQAIVADLAKQVRHKVGEEEIWASELYRQFKELLDDLLSDPAMSLAAVLHTLGGVSKTEARRVNCNPDSRRIQIREGQYSKGSLLDHDPYNIFFLQESD